MVETPYKIDEIVWAKIRGYSWWPGVICNIDIESSDEDQSSDSENEPIFNFTVNFIGENTQQFTISAVLRENKICKFDEYLQKFSRTQNKTLKRSIDVAKRLQRQELDIKNLKQINEEFFSGSQFEHKQYQKKTQRMVKTAEAVKVRKLRNKPREVSELESNEDIVSLSEISEKSVKPQEPEVKHGIEAKIHNVLENFKILNHNPQAQHPQALNRIIKIQNEIQSFINWRVSQTDAQQISEQTIFDSLKFLINLQPQAYILRELNAIEIVKMFKEQFIDSQNPNLQAMARLAHKLQLFWSKSILQEELHEHLEKSQHLTTNTEETLLGRKRIRSGAFRESQMKASSSESEAR